MCDSNAYCSPCHFNLEIIDGMIIIQLQDAMFEGIRNIQIQGLQTVLFKHYRRRVVYNDVTRHYVTRYLTLSHVAENRNVKCPVHFFPLEYVYSLRYEQNA